MGNCVQRRQGHIRDSIPIHVYETEEDKKCIYSSKNGMEVAEKRRGIILHTLNKMLLDIKTSRHKHYVYSYEIDS
jgi:hypothetical protein